MISINGLKMGRCQGVRISGQAAPRPVTELGTDHVVEFVAGIKQYQGTIQSITIVDGDLVKRLASMSGGVFDASSYSATLSNLPEFDINVLRRGLPNYNSPTLFAQPGSPQDLAGTGKLIKTYQGVVIESFEQSLNVNESLIMESCSFRCIDIVTDPGNTNGGNQQLFSGFPTGTSA